MCAIGWGIALLALGADLTSTGTASLSGTAGASDDAGAAGGRSFAEGRAVGGDMFSAVQLPLEAADISPDDDAADGSGGVAGAATAAAVAADAAIGAGVWARIGGGRSAGVGGFGGGVAPIFAIGGGVGTRGTLPSGTRGIAAAGVGTRGFVIDFGRGAFAGVGTLGRGFGSVDEL